MHNSAFRVLGMDSRYEIFEEPLEGFLKRFRADEKMRGLSVSLPYKEKIIPLLDEVSEDAVKIGAVNTILKTDKRLRGFNTDHGGFIRSLEEEGVQIKGTSFVIYGAGGAARAIIYGILNNGGKVVSILNRTVKKAEMMAKEFSLMFGVKISGGELKDLNKEDVKANVLIQSTAMWNLGGFDEEEVKMMFTPEALKKFSVVVDIAYKPLITPLLKLAKGEGCKIVTGEKMLLYQAMEQFEIWTGKAAPMKAMLEELVVS